MATFPHRLSPAVGTPIIKQHDVLVSFDPGETTGITAGIVTGFRSFDVLQSYQIAWHDQYNIKAILASHQPAWIIIEAFRLFRHKARSQIGSEFPSCQIIGAIRNFAIDLWGPSAWSMLIYQSPSDIANVKIQPEHLNFCKVDGRLSEHLKDSYKHLRRSVMLLKYQTSQIIPDDHQLS